MRRSSIRRTAVLADVCAAMERIAPTCLAQPWDNVGLLAGDVKSAVRRILLTIDLTRTVVDEAVRKRTDLILSYHPPIFQPTKSLRASGDTMETQVYRCVRAGIAIYSPHTALDAADGGTNDALARLCGIRQSEPLGYVIVPKGEPCKFVVFVPPADAEKVAEAIFEAGAGQIGDYSRCSFRTPGEGTFFGGTDAHPAVGRPGRMEYVPEVRLESVVDAKNLARVVQAMRAAHPYEEPAFDVYPLKPEPQCGIGRWGRLPRTMTLQQLARRLERQIKAKGMQLVGRRAQPVEMAVIVAGAAGDLPFHVPLSDRHVIITGEMRHHDALRVWRNGCSAIALGHWASERPVLKPLAHRLAELVPGLALSVSAADRDPFSGLT